MRFLFSLSVVVPVMILFSFGVTRSSDAENWVADWPQWRGLKNGVWDEPGIVEKFKSKKLKIKWSVPISSGYSAPTIAKGRVYVNRSCCGTEAN